MEKRARNSASKLEQMVEAKRFPKQAILTREQAEALQGEDITIPAGIGKIAANAFMCRKELKSVTIPEGVAIICNAAFAGCSNLAVVEVPDSVYRIEPCAFVATSWYENQPDGLVYAGKVAYEYKGEMPENTDIVIREGTLAIAEEAFTDSNIASVTMPASLKYIGKGQFKNCNEDFRKRVTIRCHESSLAHSFALANGMKVELLE
jgi:hypothetical protein